MEQIWTMLMHKILQNHLLCAFKNWRYLHALAGKFLRQKSCYLESFRFLWLCCFLQGFFAIQYIETGVAKDWKVMYRMGFSSIELEPKLNKAIKLWMACFVLFPIPIPKWNKSSTGSWIYGCLTLFNPGWGADLPPSSIIKGKTSFSNSYISQTK